MGAWRQSGACQVRGESTEACFVKIHCARPTLHGDDGEGEVHFLGARDEAGEFACRKAVANGDGQMTDKGFEAGIYKRSFEARAVEGIGTVEDHDFFACACGGAHDVSEGTDKGVEADADVLPVKDEDILVLQYHGRWCFGCAVEAVDGESGARVAGIINGGGVRARAVKAVFGSEEGGDVQVVLQEDVEGVGIIGGDGGGVGDETDAAIF